MDVYCLASSKGRGWARLGWAVLVVTVLGVGSGGRTHADEAVARFFPRENLAVYFEVRGLDAIEEAWHKTAAYRILSQTKTGALLEELALSAVNHRDQMNQQAGLQDPGEFRFMLRHVLKHGFAIGVVSSQNPDQPYWGGLVLRGAGQGRPFEVVEKWIAQGRSGDEAPVMVERGEQRQVRLEGGLEDFSIGWWQEKNDLALGFLSMESVDAMTQAVQGKIPSAVEHPAHAELAKGKEALVQLAFGFADPNTILRLPSDQAAALGIDKVKQVEYCLGIQGPAIVTQLRIPAAAPRSGLLLLFDQPVFGPEQFNGLPTGLVNVAAFSIKPGEFYDRMVSGLVQSNPSARTRIDALELKFREITGVRIRDDLLAHLGSKMKIYVQTSQQPAQAHALGGLVSGLLGTPRVMVVVEAKDRAELAKLLERMAARTEDYVRANGNRLNGSLPIRVQPLKGVEDGFVVSISQAVAPLPAGLRPTFVVGEKSLIFSTNPSDAIEAVALEKASAPLPGTETLAQPIETLPNKLIYANVVDTKQSVFPEVIANLPAVLHWGQALRYGTMGNTRLLIARQVMMGGGMNQQGGMARLGPWVVLEPGQAPAPEEIRPFLFPSTFTLKVDEQGIEFVSRQAFPVLNPVSMLPFEALALLPVSRASRNAARKVQSINNLKQIGLAFHNFHSTFNFFPPLTRYDKNKKPLLSWRVAILPYIEQAPLYNEFKLDEPWDSPHNKALIPKMPKIFAIPGAKTDPGKTFYRAFSGAGTAFSTQNQGETGVSIRDITDGTSNTLGVVEAKEAVIWTKPDSEIPFDAGQMPPPAALVNGLGGHFPGGFNVMMLDGSIRFVKSTINPMTLRALITRSGGEVISNDAF